MNIAPRVQDYLAARQCAYELVAHPLSANSHESARTAHVRASALAKAVVLKDRGGAYVLAVLPSSAHVVPAQLGRALHREPLTLAREAELAGLFTDCAWGALPPLGRLYGLPTIVEQDLDEERDVYFEAGDHEHLVHMAQAEFYRLTCDAPRAHFSRSDEKEEPLWMQ